MLICMRTTLVLEDRLLREAKRQAASRGITLSELVGEALRAQIGRARDEPIGRFEMVTFSGGAGPAHHEPRDFANALDAEEQGSLGR